MSAESIPPPTRREVGAFPVIYHDESLYSVVARFGHLTGYPDAASANLDLFDHDFGYAATALPSNLDVLALHLPAGLALTGSDLALRHTLFPYRTAFLTKAAAEESITRARAKPDLQHLTPTRIVERPLPKPPGLRFCPECHRDMKRSRQELHWKRVHQLAIVTLCPDHKCDLRETSVSPAVGDKVLHLASDELCGNDLPSVIPADTAVDREVLLKLARQARTLLEGKYPEGMTRKSGRDYAQLFRDLGYYRKDRLDWGRLLPDAQAAVANIVAALPGLATISRDGMGWFAHAMSSNRPDHTDSVLITAMIARTIKAVAPRFWASMDDATGQPLMPLASTA